MHLLKRDGEEITVEFWPIMTKEQVADALVKRIADGLAKPAEKAR